MHRSVGLDKKKVGVILTLGLVITCWTGGLGLLLPLLLKDIVKSSSKGETDDEITSRASYLKSTLDFCTTFTYFVLAPLLGAFTDHFGRKMGVLAAFLSMGIDYALLLLAHKTKHLYPFYIGAVGGCLSGSIQLTAAAYMADISTPEDKSKNFGLLGGGLGMGIIIGPLIFGYLTNQSISLALLVGLGITVGGGLLVILFLPESLDTIKKPDQHDKVAVSLNPLKPLKILFFGTNTFVTVMGFVHFLESMSVTSLVGTLVLYVTFRYQWSPFEIGILMGTAGVMMILNYTLVLRGALKLLGERKTLFFGFFMALVALIAATISFESWIFMVAVAFAMSAVLAVPVIQTLISNCVSNTVQGQVMGAMASTQSLAGLFGSLIFENVFAYFISERAFFYFPAAHFFLAACLTVVIIITTAILFCKYPASPICKRNIETLPLLDQADISVN